MASAVNRTGCIARGVAHGERVGQDLLRLAFRARVEGKLSQEEWENLPSTPRGMMDLLLSPGADKRIIEALLDTYHQYSALD